MEYLGHGHGPTYANCGIVNDLAFCAVIHIKYMYSNSIVVSGFVLVVYIQFVVDITDNHWFNLELFLFFRFGQHMLCIVMLCYAGDS